jgi:hypothetical protein
MTVEEAIYYFTGHTPDEIRNMDDDALLELIVKMRDEGYQEGYDDAHEN